MEEKYYLKLIVIIAKSSPKNKSINNTIFVLSVNCRLVVKSGFKHQFLPDDWSKTVMSLSVLKWPLSNTRYCKQPVHRTNKSLLNNRLMVKSSVSARSLKLSNNEPGKYLDGWPLRDSRYLRVPERYAPDLQNFMKNRFIIKSPIFTKSLEVKQDEPGE